MPKTLFCSAIWQHETAVFCKFAAKNVMRHGVLVVKFGIIRRKNVKIRCRNGEIIASYAEIPYCFRAFVVLFLRKFGSMTAV